MVDAGGQNRDDPKEKLDALLEPADGTKKSDRDRADLAEQVAKEGHNKFPPGFVNYGEAEPIIDRDEVWVH